MPADSPPLLDIRAFLEAQRRERFRAFILHGPPLCGKSRFARKLAQSAGGAYVDVLAHVAGSPELSDKVDVLDVPFLKRLAVDAAAGDSAPLVVVDEWDFLLPVWADLAPLVEMVRRLSQTETAAVPCFVLQSQPLLDGLSLPNTRGQNRVLRLEEIQRL